MSFAFNLESSQTALVALFVHQMGTDYRKNKSHTKDFLYINYICKLLKRVQYTTLQINLLLNIRDLPTTRTRRDIGSQRGARHHEERRFKS